MTELKTLKEIQRFEDLKHSDHFIVSSETLRQEAIKWIKKLEESIFHSPSFEGSIEASKKKMNNMIQATWIKHFFNITEEDLK